MSNKIQTENISTKDISFEQPSTYNIDGKSFIVKPVFKDNTSETLGTVLLRLMKSSE